MYPGGNIIRITPTLHAAASTDNDVLFQTTEIPNAVSSRGGVSKLINVSYTCKQALGLNLDLIIMEVDTDFNNGTLGATLNISDSDLVACKPLCALEWGGAPITLNGNEINDFTNDSSNNDPGQLPILLKASEGSTSVYFTAIDRDGGDTFVDGDLTFTFSIEYLG